MKKIILSLFLLGTLLSANAQVPNYVPSNGLVGWWPFNGNANDVSGNGNNGTVNGATLTTDRFGNSSNAYHFNNTGSISVPSIEFHNYLNTGFSLSYWYTLEDSTGLNRHFLFSNYDGNNGLQIESGFDVNSKVVGLRQILRTGTTTPDYELEYIYYGFKYSNLWKFVTIVWSKPTLSTYINGVLVNQTSNTGISDIKSNWGTRFGSYGNGNSSHHGKLDDIGIWNRSLTASEVKDLYNDCKLTITTEPINKSSSINGQAQFNTLANDTTSSYQWQSNSSSMGWANVPSNSIYSGTTSKKLTVSNIQVNNHKQLFRVIASKNTCKDTSVVAMLTVNDTCITSTTDTLYIKVNTSSLSNPVYNTVKVYPNPSSTKVIIDNGNFSTMGSYTAKIVNSIGQQVFQSVINQQQFVIDAKTMGGAGVYTLYITDANNKVVGVKKIVLQ